MEYQCIPQDDFDCYYNSEWKTKQKNNYPIVSNFTLIQDEINEEIYQFITDANNVDQSEFLVDKLVLFRNSYSKRHFFSGTLQYLVDNIASIQNFQDMTATISRLVSLDIPTLFSIGICSHHTNPNIYTLRVDEMLLSLESPEEYQNDDSKNRLLNFISILAEIHKYIKNKWNYHSSPRIDFIKNILAVEILFSGQMLSLAESHDPRIICNSMKFHNFTKEFGSDFWGPVLDPYLQPDSYVSFSNHHYLHFLKNFLNKIDQQNLTMVKDYLVYCVVRNYGLYLEISHVVRKLYFNHNSDKKIFIDLIQHTFGPYLEEVYNKKYFNPEKEKIILEMFEKMKRYCRDFFETTPLFADETKREALEKINKLDIIVGSQKHHINLAELPALGDNFYQNLMSIDAFYFKKTMDLANQPIDRRSMAGDRGIFSFIINAYYSPNHNMIYVPTAIMHDIFVKTHCDMLYNYGGIGTVIGHEIMHCFDNYGALYDSNGYFRNWWKKEDYENFDMEVKKVTNYYASLKYNGIKLNAEANTGENMADICGLKISFRTYIKYCIGNPKYFTQEEKNHLKLFFKRWAQNFRSVAKTDFIKHLSQTDHHAPGSIRINAPFCHLSEYYLIFNPHEINQNYLSPEKRTILLDLVENKQHY